ncbi:MAG TPA: hypothetical protein VMT17_16445 [Anaeromyxobacteraceae bacterium]|nr:hypothetical protein [Anaeromyxobacteraceae bacterium]
MPTKVVSRLQERIDELPEGSFRRQVLESARRFKSSWVELGRLLSRVRADEAWRPWGFDSFESYCSKELFLTRATSDKLTTSYAFLERREPEVARSRGVAEAPPFEVIEVLSRAEASGRLDDEAWAEMRDGVLDGEAGRAEVVRRIAERFGPAPAPPAPKPAERLARLAAAARRLAEACEEEREVPAALKRHARELADALARIAEE